SVAAGKRLLAVMSIVHDGSRAIACAAGSPLRSRICLAEIRGSSAGRKRGTPTASRRTGPSVISPRSISFPSGAEYLSGASRSGDRPAKVGVDGSREGEGRRGRGGRGVAVARQQQSGGEEQHVVIRFP